MEEGGSERERAVMKPAVKQGALTPEKFVCTHRNYTHAVTQLLQYTWFKERELAEQRAVPATAQSRVERSNGAGATQYPMTAESVTRAAGRRGRNANSIVPFQEP